MLFYNNVYSKSTKCPILHTYSWTALSRLLGNSDYNHLENLQLIDGYYYAIGPDSFVKLDLNGQLIWATEISDPELKINDYVETSDNAFLLVGRGTDGSFISKINENGTLLSTNNYNFNSAGFFVDIIKVETPSSTPQYFVTGYLGGGGGGSGNALTIFLEVLENGTASSLQRIEPISGAQYPFELMPLNNSQIGLIGTSGTAGFIGITDTLGSFSSAWLVNPFCQIEEAVELPGSNDLVVVGGHNGSAIIGRINNMGQTIWSEKIPQIEILTKIVRANDGSYYALGFETISGVKRYTINHFVENGGTVILDYSYFVDQGAAGSPDSSRPGDLNISSNNDLLFSQTVLGNPNGFGGYDTYLGFFDTNISLDCRQDTSFQLSEFILETTVFTEFSVTNDILPSPSMSYLTDSIDLNCYEPCIPIITPCTELPLFITCQEDITFDASSFDCSYPFTPFFEVYFPCQDTLIASDYFPNGEVTLSRSDFLPITAPWPVGVTAVSAIATNPNGQTFCDFIVTILDNTPPFFIECPQDITVQAPPGDLSVTLNIPYPQATDNCGIETTDYDYFIDQDWFCGTQLVTCTATDFSGNTSTCTFSVTVECPVECTPVSDTCCNSAVDVLFVLDNSGSISPSEFDNMVTLAQNAMLEVDTAYCDALFSVVHYSGDCGSSIYIENDFDFATNAQSITRPSGGFTGGDDLDKALGKIENALLGISDPTTISSTMTFSPRSYASLLVVIFTDAASLSSEMNPCIGGGSALRPYNNANILKAAPHNANITLVHFEPTLPGVQSVGAAIASAGGSYTGAVDPNPGDPTNSTLPRQFIAATFATSTINILDATPPCDSLEAFICCDNLVVNTIPDQNPNICCYSIDLSNNSGSTITSLETEIITPGWQFNTGSLTIGSGYNWQSTPTNNILTIEHSSGSIPSGASANTLQYCLIPTVANPSTSQTIIYRWYQDLPDGTKRVVCTETVETSCSPVFPDPCLSMDSLSIACNPDNPYEYLLNFTVTNNSDFDADKIVLEDLNTGFSFSACFVSSPTNIIAIPTDPGILIPGATSNNMCVKIISPYPIFSAEEVCFDLGLFGEFDCCHSVDSVCITLENCCDPCESRNVVVEEMQTDSADCCYSLDIVDSCGYAYFTKIETEIITPGVIFGYHAIGGPDAADWFILPNSDQTSITWWSDNSFIPYGTTEDIMQFCLSGITSSAQVPQQVVIKWYAQDRDSLDFLACTDTLDFNCDVEVPDYSCLNISDRDLECVEDSSKYRYSFTVTNTSTVPFSADYLDVTIVEPSGIYFDPSGGFFGLPQPFNPGDSHQVNACIKSTGSFPVTPQDLILRYRLRFAQGDTCCYNAQLDTLFLPPCGPPNCDSLVVTIDQSTSDSCCHTLDFKNLYNGDIQSIELEVLTPGVLFGNHSTGGPDAADWYNPLSTATKIQWALLSGNQLPFGSYDDLVNFCLDGIDAGETPQEVIIRWLDADSMELCSDTLIFDCIDEYNCVDFIDSQLSCDDNGDYDFNFTMLNNSNLPHSADLLKVRPVPPTNPIQFSNGDFPLSPILNFGDSYSGSTTITGAVPGDTLKFEVRLEDTSSGDSWCCFESDTFSIVIPSCCCSDSTSFFDLVDMGFDTLLVCDTLTVTGLGLDSCHQVIWTWEDGTPDSDPIPGDSSAVHFFDWPGEYNVCMLVQNLDDDGNVCWEKSYCEMVTVAPCCDLSTIVINNGLTPNGDGFNDDFKLTGIERCKGVSVKIYNRWGNIVYKQSDYEEGPNWDGISMTRIALPQGTYYYIIEFKDIDEKKAGYLDVRY